MVEIGFELPGWSTHAAFLALPVGVAFYQLWPRLQPGEFVGLGVLS